MTPGSVSNVDQFAIVRNGWKADIPTSLKAGTKPVMLQVALFHEFKGADTVLVWGDADGLNELHETLMALASGEQQSACIGAGERSLTIKVDREKGFFSDRFFSHLTFDVEDKRRLCWTCSPSILDNTEGLVAALTEAESGHQYVGVSGSVAEQIMFSVGEYPGDMTELD